MDNAIKLDQKTLYELGRSIIYINVCKKKLFKSNHNIYI